MASEEPKRTEAKEAEAEAGCQDQPKVRNCFFFYTMLKNIRSKYLVFSYITTFITESMA